MRSGFYEACIRSRFICSAPVRGGTHFLCCCKESKQRKQLSTANPCQCASRPLPRSGPTGGVSLAGFHRCWHVDEVRASHRYTKWTSNHSSGLALRAHPSGKAENQVSIHSHSLRLCLLHALIAPLGRPFVGHEVPWVARASSTCRTAAKPRVRRRCGPLRHGCGMVQGLARGKLLSLTFAASRNDRSPNHSARSARDHHATLERRKNAGIEVTISGLP